MPRLSQQLLLSASQYNKDAKSSPSADGHLRRLTHLNLAERGLEAIQPDDVLPICRALTTLYLYDNEIETVENLDVLGPTLTSLYLQNNLLRSLDSGLARLGKLTKLYLNGNRIAHVAGLVGLPLAELYIGRQKLPPGTAMTFDADSLASLARTLTKLDVSANGIVDCSPLGALQRLDEIDLSENAIETAEPVGALLAGARFARTLDLRGCPLTRRPKYTDGIVVLSMRLAVLDGQEVNENQRRFLIAKAQRARK